MPEILTNISPHSMHSGEMCFHVEHTTKLLTKLCKALEADGLFKDYATKPLRKWWKCRKRGQTVNIPESYFYKQTSQYSRKLS